MTANNVTRTSLKVSASFLSQLLGYLLSLIALALLSRALGPDPIGTVAYFTSFLGLLSILLDMGLSSAHVKRVSEGQDLGTAIGTFLSTKLVLIGFYVVAVFLASYWLGYLDSATAAQTSRKYVLLILFLGVVLNSSIGAVVTTTFQARRETAKQYIPMLIGRIVYLLGAIYIALVAPTVVGLALVYLASSVFSVITGVWLFRGMPIHHPTRAMFKSYLSFGLPMLVAVAAGTIITYVDQVMIGAFLTNTEVGYYTVPLRFSKALEFISVAVMTLLFPTISAFLAQGHREQAYTTLDQALKYINLIYWPAMALVFVFAKPLMIIFFWPSVLACGCCVTSDISLQRFPGH